jgi:hypothetical protein
MAFKNQSFVFVGVVAVNLSFLTIHADIQGVLVDKAVGWLGKIMDYAWVQTTKEKDFEVYENVVYPYFYNETEKYDYSKPSPLESTEVKRTYSIESKPPYTATTAQITTTTKTNGYFSQSVTKWESPVFEEGRLDNVCINNSQGFAVTNSLMIRTKYRIQNRILREAVKTSKHAVYDQKFSVTQSWSRRSTNYCHVAGGELGIEPQLYESISSGSIGRGGVSDQSEWRAKNSYVQASKSWIQLPQK